MKAPGARETLNWGLVGVIGLGVFWIASKMGILPSLFSFGGSPALAAGNSYTEQLDQIKQQVDESTKAAVETRQGWLDAQSYAEQRGYLYYHPELQRAFDDYYRELDEYIDVLSRYGGEDQEDYARVWDEYRDVQTADEALRSIYMGVIT